MADTNPTPRFNRINNLAGRTFTRLIVANMADHPTGGKVYWNCICHCGYPKIVVVQSSKLISGNTQSCGCLQRERTAEAKTTHGLSKTRVHTAWSNMKNRCQNPRNRNYYKYGARGITVCERWQTFENFLADMGEPPSPKHSIDRYPDNGGNYEPGNVRWATAKEQGNNQRTNHLITLNGETLTMQQWCEKLDIKQGTLSKRINRLHWSTQKALTTPIRTR